MTVVVYESPETANTAAAGVLTTWLTNPSTRTVMVAAGHTPLKLYAEIAALKLPLSHLTLLALDEYLGVPLDEPRNCANLLRKSVAEPWGIPPLRFVALPSLEPGAEFAVREQERRIAEAGGLDILILGLGQNGHLGFNEPGSLADSAGRVLDLQPISIEANRQWFGGKYAPHRGVTVGLKTILAARRIVVLAYGPHKTAAVAAMVQGPVGAECPASFLQSHPCVQLFLDRSAASGLHATS